VTHGVHETSGIRYHRSVRTEREGLEQHRGKASFHDTLVSVRRISFTMSAPFALDTRFAQAGDLLPQRVAACAACAVRSVRRAACAPCGVRSVRRALRARALRARAVLQDVTVPTL
jgi:hypothetical protein